ncbi:TonB-dependent receptor domain-containing protein [Paremcibacter congregatus]|uniref:Secretin/TonB short N-terminal domain-containing protein n=1 Tax=Paremcibacter congregatus TaxID=2043170 RepID=A0A2G4YR05_9PROT|nr:TonB-dependent receptor [Paremcibacter congregatus]PHZ84727.1 hypothetical protein CRD36_10605 [Paremcibacter congregatus]QDE28922.1 TonB-dependent receptor [Paremcibacter congregatus]
MKKLKNTVCSAALIASFIAATLFISTSGRAEEEARYDLEVKPQSLAKAIRAFSKQADVQVLYSLDLVKGLSTTGVSGKFSREDGLARLLVNLGLTLKQIDAETFVVVSMSENKSTTLAQKVNMSMTGSGEPQVQLADKDVREEPESVFSLDEIVVTAQKRSQSLQDVPMAVEVRTDEFFAKTGMVDFEAYARTITNIGFTPPAAGNVGFKHGISMRGISPTEGAPVVAMYIDDTPVSGFGAAGLSVDARIFDVERVEILKGPQGNLYGSSSMGGVIKIIPRKPALNDFHVKFDGTLSSTRYGGKNILMNAAINLPVLEDVAALRVVVVHGDEEGYIDRVPRFPGGDLSGSIIPAPETVEEDQNINTVDLLSVRASLLYRPNEWLEVIPSVYYQRKKYGGVSAVSEDVFGLGGNPRISTYQDDYLETDFALYSLKAVITTAVGDITSISSYLKSTSYNIGDGTNFVSFLTGAAPTLEDTLYFPGLTVTDKNEAFTQEIRFVSNWDFPVQVTTGLYYQDADEAQSRDWVGPAGAGDHFGIGTDVFFLSRDPSKIEEKALFGNLTYEAGPLEVQVGARYFDISVNRAVAQDGIFASSFAGTESIGSTSDNGVSLSASLAYALTDDHLVYVRAAEGFRRGILEASPPAVCGDFPDGLVQIQPDGVWNYELGAKTQWVDDRVRVNATAFWIDYTNVQQSMNLSCGFNVVENAGSATAKGVEVELIAEPLESLTLSASLGYVKSTLDEDAPALGGDAGESLLGVPKWTANASVQYIMDTPNDDLDIYVRGDWSYTSSKTEDYGTLGTPSTGFRDSDAYSLFNARLGLISDMGWDASLFVSNLFDERARLQVSHNGLPKAYINKPRTLGINFKKDF